MGESPVRERRVRRGGIQSRARHVEPCLKARGPPRNPKYYPVTDSIQYREGKVKRTPPRGVKENLKPRVHNLPEGYTL